MTRQPAEWEALCVTLTLAGIEKVHTTKSGPVSVTPEHRLLGRVMAAVDAEEVERLRARTRRAHAALAAEGRPNGGAQYGYRHVRDAEGRAALEVVPEQAAAIRRMAAMVRAGHSVASIAAALDESRVPTPRGGRRWGRTTVRSILLAPSIAGLRAHHGEIVGPARWEAILDRDEWEQVCRLLSGEVVVLASNGRRVRVKRHRDRESWRRYLLTGGIARCGACGGPLSAAKQRSNGDRVPGYACLACWGASVVAEPLEAFVADQVLAALASPEMAARLMAHPDASEVDAAARALAEAEARMADAASLYGAGAITRAEWEALRSAAQAIAGDARDRLAALHPAAVDLPPFDELAGAWGMMTVAQRRRIITLAVSQVVVAPLVKNAPRNRFDPRRVRLCWKT